MRWTKPLAIALALALPTLAGCSDHERHDDDRGRTERRDRHTGYDDTRYGDARDGDVDGDGWRDVRWDEDRDGLAPYDEVDRATTNDEVSAPRDYTPADTGGVADPSTSPSGPATQRRDLNPSPRDSVRRSSIP